ncbi:peptidyl-prolyl cis-trans isomerase [Tropicimonas sediminicola]|uniref:peptidylprolyl isomerase n=1 Tax=Tropicimonas sediminicola TaxID=1031541 RepID=A0A239KHJ5_9RHOB|nr:peptidylprolyl isomerase [Tropicimonas sediminicola]SNT17555.1 PPIC-type PPIASE domain-containing protein [Tropicimonas sediminicola]
MRLLKEPLVHFLLLGAGLFAWYSIRAPEVPAEDAGPEIVIDAQDVDRLIVQYRATWRRPPTTNELEAMIDGLAREEVLVREAKAMGLDVGDSVIRGRLTQKMDFLTTSVAQSMEPEVGVLQEHLEANADRFRTDGRIGFEQIYLGTAPDEAATEQVLAELESGAAPDTLGQRTLLPQDVPPSARTAIDATFGSTFFEQLQALPDGAWQGPVISGYGAHLVRVTAREEARLPELDEIRDAVLFDWRREMSETLTEAQFEQLSAQYTITRPDLSDWADKVLQ